MSGEVSRDFSGGDLQGIHARFDSVDGRLDALEDKVDRRLQETRPIWEQVLAKLEGLDNKVGSLENKVGSLETKVDSLETEMRGGFRRLERMVGVLTDDVLEVRADQRDLDRRMSKLEPAP